MASYQDFSLLSTNSSTDLPAISGKNYYITAVVNADAAAQNVLDKGSVSLIKMPPSGTLTLPGRGLPIDQFKSSSTNLQVFYYIR